MGMFLPFICPPNSKWVPAGKLIAQSLLRKAYCVKLIAQSLLRKAYCVKLIAQSLLRKVYCVQLD